MCVCAREGGGEIMLGAKGGNECMKQEEVEKREKIGSASYRPIFYVNMTLFIDVVLPDPPDCPV